MRKFITDIDNRHQLKAREIQSLIHRDDDLFIDYWKAHHDRDTLLREVQRLEAKIRKLQQTVTAQGN